MAGGQTLPERNHLSHRRIGDAVHDRAALAFVCDEPTPPQAGQVVRHPRRRGPQLRCQFGNRVRALNQQIENPQTVRVTQHPEEAGSCQVEVCPSYCCLWHSAIMTGDPDTTGIPYTLP